MVINLIMIGGQVLIIFVGGAAFQITPLNGKEWGLSIGLGAISLPWGAVIRKFPDSWFEAMIPKIPLPNIWPFKSKKKQRKATEGEDVEKATSTSGSEVTKDRDRARATGADVDEDDTINQPPLRTLTSLRGRRATENIRTGGFRQYMHEKKVKVKGKAKAIGSKTDVSKLARS